MKRFPDYSKEVIDSLSNADTKHLLRVILKNRVASHLDLEKSGANSSSIKDDLRQLQKLGLIKVKKAGLEKLDRYYPTAEGLELESNL